MQKISSLLPKEIKKEKSQYKNWRDELIQEAVDDINLLRKNKYPLETSKNLAIRANSNPFLQDDGELDLVFRECRAKRTYSKFYWLTKNVGLKNKND